MEIQILPSLGTIHAYEKNTSIEKKIVATLDGSLQFVENGDQTVLIRQHVFYGDEITNVIQFNADISKYKANHVTIQRVSTAGASQAPQSRSGVLETIRFDADSDFFSYQLWKPVVSKVVWCRKWTTETNSWNVWYIASGCLIGTSSERPTTNLYDGLVYKDTTLKKTLTYYPPGWHDETGTMI